jgi:hypothetical protein
MTGDLRSCDCMSFGVPFRLTADSDVLLTAMQKYAPMGMQVEATISEDARNFTMRRLRGGAGYRLEADGDVVDEGVTLQPILDKFACDLMVHIANFAPDRVFLHAGVVGWQGDALLLPGKSFAGKTTLVAELVRAGATYYSDEYAVLDERGRVHPYARELQMREPGGAAQKSVGVALLGGVEGIQPLAVSRVVFTEFIESGIWNPEPVSAGLAVLDMIRHAIPVQRTPARVMATLARMMETATAVRTERGEAREVANLLLDAMIIGEVSR